MYHPTTRLLTILELLQTYRSISGAALAQRLEVEPRSVRRYILMLQDMGMPIEAVRGPGGGYQLRPGFKLPPLMFSEEEATAIVLGLLGSTRLDLGQSPMAIEGALAKVLRVLPVRARERLSAVSANVMITSDNYASQPDAMLLLDLSEAIQSRRRLALDYHASGGSPRERIVEPYGVVGWWGNWYLVAFCCMRQDWRTFRLDRILDADVQEDTFERVDDFDIQHYMIEHFTKTSSSVEINILFHAPLHAAQRKIPVHFGTLTETDEGVLLHTQHGHLGDAAHFLVSTRLPFTVLDPPELRAELLHLAEQITRYAGAGL